MTIWMCAACGRKAAKVIRRGKSKAKPERYPRRHRDSNGLLCVGMWKPAVLVDKNGQPVQSTLPFGAPRETNVVELARRRFPGRGD
jgi:hypothetical protein